MRKKLIQVIAIVALALGLILGSGAVGKAKSPHNFVAPRAIDGGGSNG